jgi:putative SOS response-associated peptidase YedK
MCGKFEARLTWDEYCDLAGVGPGEGGDALDAATVLGLFTPMARVPVLHLGPVGRRRLTLMRWGWHNHKLADPMRGFSHLHARSEEIDRTPTWVEPFRDARGVVFAKAFNIGEVLANGKTRQWVCSRADGAAMALAVVYSSRQLVQGRLTAFAMVTTQSCAPLDLKDDRMPAILKPEEVAMWIGEESATPPQLKSLLRPFDGSLVVREQQPSKPKQRDHAQAELF